jgi:hypothetical protein
MAFATPGVPFLYFFVSTSSVLNQKVNQVFEDQSVKLKSLVSSDLELFKADVATAFPSGFTFIEERVILSERRYETLFEMLRMVAEFWEEGGARRLPRQRI